MPFDDSDRILITCRAHRAYSRAYLDDFWPCNRTGRIVEYNAATVEVLLDGEHVLRIARTDHLKALGHGHVWIIKNGLSEMGVNQPEHT